MYQNLAFLLGKPKNWHRRLPEKDRQWKNFPYGCKAIWC